MDGEDSTSDDLVLMIGNEAYMGAMARCVCMVSWIGAAKSETQD